MPARSDPSSEEGQLLGPLSKRREVNLRWRYFTKEWQKVLPPLELSVVKASDTVEAVRHLNDKRVVADAGVRGVGLQGGGVLEEVQNLAGPAWKPVSTPRRARQRLGQSFNTPEQHPFSPGLPARWLRKRYQDLLGRIPILMYSSKERKGNDSNRGYINQYNVTLAPNAISPRIRYGASRLPPVDETDSLWIQLAERRQPQPVKQSQKKRHQGDTK
jgi:hypothetical protein